MPKSKRNKQISLTRTKKNPFEVKKKLIEEIRSSVDKYSSVYVFSVNDMRNNKLKDVREQWKHSRFFFGKNKVMSLALGRNSEEEYRTNLHQISNHLKGQCGLLFSNKSTKEVLNWFESYSESDFSRSGNTAVYSVDLKEGPLPQFDHSMEPYLRQLGMPTVLQRGVVHLVKDFQVCKEGDVLTPEKAKILVLLGHQMAEFKITIDCYWSNDGTFVMVNHPSDMKENAMQIDYQEELNSNNSRVSGIHIKKHGAVNKNDDASDEEDDEKEEADPMIIDDINNEDDISDQNHGDSRTVNHTEEKEDLSENCEISVNEYKKDEDKSFTENIIELDDSDSDVEVLHTSKRASLNIDRHTDNEPYKEEDALEKDPGNEDIVIIDPHEVAVENNANKEDKLNNDVDKEGKLDNDADKEDNLENDVDKEDVPEKNANEDNLKNVDEENDPDEKYADKQHILESSAKGDIATAENDLAEKEEVVDVTLENSPNKIGHKLAEKDMIQTVDEKSKKNETPKDKLPLRKRILASRDTEKECVSVVDKSTKRKQDSTESNPSVIKKSKTNKKMMKDVVSSPDEQSPIFRSLRNRTVKIRRKKAK